MLNIRLHLKTVVLSGSLIPQQSKVIVLAIETRYFFTIILLPKKGFKYISAGFSYKYVVKLKPPQKDLMANPRLPKTMLVSKVKRSQIFTLEYLLVALLST